MNFKDFSRAIVAFIQVLSAMTNELLKHGFSIDKIIYRYFLIQVFIRYDERAAQAWFLALTRFYIAILTQVLSVMTNELHKHGFTIDKIIYRYFIFYF